MMQPSFTAWRGLRFAAAFLAVFVFTAPALADDAQTLLRQLEAGDNAAVKAGLVAAEAESDAEKAALWLVSAALALDEGKLATAVVSMTMIDVEALPPEHKPLFDSVSAELNRRLSNPDVYEGVRARVQQVFADDFSRALRLGQAGEPTRIFAEQFIDAHFGAADVGNYEDAALLVPQRTGDMRTSGFASLRHRLWHDDNETLAVGAAVRHQLYFEEDALDFVGLTANMRYSRMLDSARVLHLTPFVARDLSGSELSGLAYRGGLSAALTQKLEPGRELGFSLGAQAVAYDTANNLDGWRADMSGSYTAFDIAPDMRLVLHGGVTYRDTAHKAFDRASVRAGPAVTWFDVAGAVDITARASVGGAWHFADDTVETSKTRRDFIVSAGVEVEYPLPDDRFSIVSKAEYFRQDSNIARQDYDNGRLGLGIRLRF